MHSSSSMRDLQSVHPGQLSSRTASAVAGARRPVLPLQYPASKAQVAETSKGKLKEAWGEFSAGWPTTWMGWLQLLLPCLRWMRIYDWKSDLKLDIIAGITVGTMLVPQAMSYANLAGLDSIYGLYAGVVPVFVYAIFGSSRQLAVGPVALVSLMTTSVLSEIVDVTDESDETQTYYTELAILLALMVGVIECLMGLFRLGWLIRFISHTVISGFTSASAIVIALSQSKYFLGYSVTRSSKIIPLVESITSGLSGFKWRPFLFGSVMLSILMTMKHLGKLSKKLRFVRAGGPLTVVVIGTLFAWVADPSDISLVGSIPQGLPSFSVPSHFDKIPSLIGTAFLLTFVAILESIGIAKTLAAKNDYELDSNQELLGLGIANVCGSFFCSYTSTGSFSRSAVNNESGARSGLTGIITGLIMTGALLFLTPLFEHVPECTLAAIVISAVLGLIDYEEPMFLWQVDKRDFVLWITAFFITLFFGVEMGVVVAVGVSLAFVIYESANPHIAVLGRLPGTTVYRNIKQYPESYRYPGIVLIRIDAPMYFANIAFIKDGLRKYELKPESGGQPLQYLIIELSPVTHIDGSAVQALKQLQEEYKSRNIQLAFANPNHQVMATLTRSRLPDIMGREWFFVRMHDAVQSCLSHMQTRQVEVNIDDGEGREQQAFRNETQSAAFDQSSVTVPLLSGHNPSV